MNAQLFIESLSIPSYIPLDGISEELDYLLSLSPAQATLYFERKIQKARTSSILYSALQKEKYYVVLSKDEKNYEMVKGATLLNFVVKVASPSDIRKEVKKCTSEKEIRVSAFECDTLFRYEVESWKTKVEDYVSDIKNVCELDLLARSTLLALYNFTKEKKADFFEKARNTSDSQGKNKNIVKAQECNTILIILQGILTKKSSM